MTALRGLRVCLWRHLVVRSRHWVSSLSDLLLPCGLFSILALMHSSFGDNFGPVFHKERLKKVVPLTDLACEGRWEAGRLLYSPRSGPASLLMAMLQTWIQQTCCEGLQDTSCYKAICNDITSNLVSYSTFP